MQTLTPNLTPKQIDGFVANYDVRQIVTPKTHRYEVWMNDELKYTYPGVTGILGIIDKPGIKYWYAEMALKNVRAALEKKRGKKVTLSQAWIDRLIKASRKNPEIELYAAADLGTMAHEWFDKYIDNVNIEIPEQIKHLCNSFIEWHKSCGLRFLCGDTDVASIRHGYGGALDALALVVDSSCTPKELELQTDDYVLIDYKTSNKVYPSHAMQAAGAYMPALFETYGIKAAAVVVLKFPKDVKESFSAHWCKGLDFIEQAFLATLDLKKALSKQDEFFI